MKSRGILNGDAEYPEYLIIYYYIYYHFADVGTTIRGDPGLVELGMVLMKVCIWP